MSTVKLLVLFAAMGTFSTVSATLTSKISGYSYHIGNCPIVEAQTNFNMNLFMGMWYVLYRTSTGTDCLTLNIEATDNPEKFRVIEVSKHLFVGLTNINHKYSYEAELTVPDKSEPARMKIKLPATLIKKASFVVIMTDYETFGLVFSCQKLAFANRQATFIMSRSPKLAQIYIDKIRNRLNGYGINHFALSNINQTCTPYDENTWEIKVNPTTLTLKGIAKTIGHHVKYGFQQTGRAVGNGINSVAQWTSGLFGVKPRRDPK
ncbi:apolipoprotein D-like [Periplaneta americana]|uniref:apolipoprotein D-like n=1 Tax=Periplaneta americana TaxID=6978 RepID=UPI0037E8D18B